MIKRAEFRKFDGGFSGSNTGKQGIELDVHLTKDKKIAVFHDDSLKRMCKVSGTIEEKTWEELKKAPASGDCRANSAA